MRARTVIFRILKWTAIVLAGLVLLLAALRLAIGAGWGNWLIAGQLGGRVIGGQTVQLDDLGGDPMSRFHIGRLALSDAGGVWLVAEDIELDWRALSLLAPPYDIDTLRAARIAVLRRPLTGDEGDDAPGGVPDLPAIRLGLLDIAELELAEGVLGPAARIRAEATAELASLQRADARLLLERLDAPGDRLSADLQLRGAEASGELEAEGMPDGPLAALIRLPGRAIRITGSLQGDLDGGAGDISLLADGTEIVAAQTQWTRETWQASGMADIREWALLPENYRDLAARAEVTAQGRFLPDPALLSARAETAGGSLDIEPAGRGAWRVALDAAPDTVAALTSGTAAASRLRWSGRVEMADPGIALTGELDAEDLAVDRLAVGRAAGPLAVRRSGDGWAVDTDLDLDGPQTDIETAARLLADTAQLGFTGEWISAERALAFERLEVESGGTALSATGRYPLGEEPPTATGRLTLADIAVLTDRASGPAMLDFDAASLSAADIQLDASEARWSGEFADLMAGLTASARLDRGERGWRLTGLHARSHGIDLAADGRLAANGDWLLEGDLAVSGRMPVDAIEIDGALATAFRAESEGAVIALRTATTSQSIAAGPILLDTPSLAVETRWADGQLAADWILEATRNGKPVALNGSATWSQAGWGGDIAQGQFGAFALTGSLTRDAEALNAALDVQLGDRATSTIRYTAPPGALREGALEAELTVTGHEFAGGYLANAHLGLSGPMSGLAVAVQADGRLRTPFNIDAQGELAVEDERIALELVPSGKWSVHRWSAPEPVRLVRSPAGIEAGGAIALGQGRIDLDYDSTGGEPAIAMTIDALPVSMLADIAIAPPARGAISGSADLVHTDGRWRGRAELNADGLAAETAAEDMPEMALRAVLTLAEDARLALDLTGGGLEAGGTLVRTGPTPDLANVTGAAGTPVSGRFEAQGSLVGLAALVTPADVTLRQADIDAELDIAGVRGAPELSGRLRIDNGHLTAAATGSTIRNLSLAGHFDGNGLDLTELSASDGRDGRLTGTGQLRVGEPGLRGEAEFAFQHFQAMSRDNLSVRATGNADLTLDEGGLLIAGASVIDQLRASPSLNGAAAIPEIEVREINLPKGRRSYSRSVLPVRLDYRIEADNGVYIASRSFSSEWAVDVHVTGPTGKPNIAGEATVVGGTVFAFSRRFSLDEGEIRFDGAPDDARIDLTASHRRTGFSATAHVEGPVRTPTVTLESDPDLPEDEILSRLLFDESVSELGAFEAAQLAAQLSGQNLLNVVGQVRDMAGIDRLDLSTDASGNIAVTGGRRFGENVYVEVGSSGASALSQALVEWQLTPDLSVLSRISADTDATIAIRWRRDY